MENFNGHLRSFYNFLFLSKLNVLLSFVLAAGVITWFLLDIRNDYLIFMVMGYVISLFLLNGFLLLLNYFVLKRSKTNNRMPLAFYMNIGFSVFYFFYFILPAFKT